MGQDIEFTDGILEVDVSVSPKKSLTGISFRGDADATCENIYLRVPLSGREDAIQYAPFFHNEDYWQLYPEHQAKYTYPETGWVHMKIVVRGNTAALYIDTATRPSAPSASREWRRGPCCPARTPCRVAGSRRNAA